MSSIEDWEAAAFDLLTELAAGIEACRLYSSEHPRADRARRRVTQRVARLFAVPVPDGEHSAPASELEIAVIQQEVFLQGRPFTRTGEHMGVLVRAFHRQGLDRLSILEGVGERDIAGCLDYLAEGGRTEPPTLERVVLGTAVTVGGAEARAPIAGSGPDVISQRLSIIRVTVDAVTDGRPPQIEGLLRVIRSLDSELAGSGDPFRSLATLQDDGWWTAVHAHNTAALSLAMCHALALETELRHDLGMAALLHDVGKFGMADHLIANDLELAGTEWELNYDHPKTGLERLLGVTQVSELAAIVAFEHHLRHDGSGFPRLEAPRPPHPAAALVAVAEAVDIMNTVRVPRGVMTISEIDEVLESGAGEAFNPFLADVMSAIWRTAW